MSLFATGRTTGTVLDAGEGVTHTVPIYEGYAIPHAIFEINLCGRDLTENRYNMLNKNVPHLIQDSSNDLDTVKLIKESMCIVA